MSCLLNYSLNNFIPQLIACGKAKLPEEHKMPHHPGTISKVKLPQGKSTTSCVCVFLVVPAGPFGGSQ